MILSSTISNNHILSLFNQRTAMYLIVVFSLIMLCYILASVFWKWLKKDNYQGVRFTTKNIAYMTMLTSVSVVATIIVSITIPITVLPPVRIAIEGLMIKITGYMFGPIVGIICAAITDLLVMLFVPSYINPVYIFCVVLTGFIAGVAGVLKVKLRKSPWIIFILINLFMILFSIGGAYIAWMSPTENISLGSSLVINKYVVAGIIGFGGVATLVIIYLTLLWYWKKGRTQRVNELLPIVLLAVVSEYMVTVMIAAYADMSLISPNKVSDYGLTMLSRAAMAPAKIIINSIIIYITWRTVNPLINIENSY